MTDSNTAVTSYSNIIRGCTQTEISVLEQAFDMWQRGDVFSHRDFDMGHGHFRKTISSLKKKGKVELDYRTSQAHYRIKGLYYPGDKRRVTSGGMEVGKEFFETLMSLDISAPSLHDLKFKFPSIIVHEALSKTRVPDPNNKGIICDINLHSNVQARIHAYPSTVLIDITSTHQPFACDLGGAMKLIDYVGRIFQHLSLLCGGKADFPEPGEWDCTEYHFAQDAKREYCGPKFEIKFNEFAGGLIRFYSKDWKDGKVRGRIEQIVSPKCKLDKVIQMMREEELRKIENRENFLITQQQKNGNVVQASQNSLILQQEEDEEIVQIYENCFDKDCEEVMNQMYEEFLSE